MSKATRRQFLEESIIASAAMVAAGSTPLRVEADDAKHRSPNETIRHAVIGCRIRGRSHVRGFASQPGVEVAYVCDPDRLLAEEQAVAAEKHQGRRPKAVQDMRQIFDDPTVDTVSIAAPNHWHALASIWAM